MWCPSTGLSPGVSRAWLLGVPRPLRRLTVSLMADSREDGRAARVGRVTTRGAWKGALPDSGVLETLGSVGNPFLSSSSYDVSEDESTSGRDPCVCILFPLPPSPFAVIAGKKCLCDFRFIAVFHSPVPGPLEY